MPITPMALTLPTAICPFCKTLSQHLMKSLYYTCEHEDPPLEDHFEKYDASLAVCTNCQKEAIWHKGSIIFPKYGSDIELPNLDLPEDIKDDYLEASSIVGISPRGAAALLRLCIQKLCNFALEKEMKIDRAIAELSMREMISEQIEKQLDIVRITGNEAVHPGSMDLKDDVDTARSLFSLVNSCADALITKPIRIDAQYNSLPEGKRKGVDDRKRRR